MLASPHWVISLLCNLYDNDHHGAGCPLIAFQLATPLEDTSVRKQLYDFSHYEKWCHLQVKASKHGRDSQLACDSHKQIIDTTAMSHLRISWLKSSNSRVGISRETSSHILHPLLSSVSTWVASNESRMSATLHLSQGVRHFLKSRTPCPVKSEIKPVKSVFACKLKRFFRKLKATWAEISWNQSGNQGWNQEISYAISEVSDPSVWSCTVAHIPGPLGMPECWQSQSDRVAHFMTK